MPKIDINVEKTLDRGPRYGFLEVQVSFEQQTSQEKAVNLASVIVSLPKVEVGSISFDEIRKMALAKALSFMEECIRTGRAS